MANLSVDGINDMLALVDGIANIPRSVISDMLDAGAEHLIKAQKKNVPVRTGRLKESIEGHPVKMTYDGGYKDVYPTGTHHTNKNGKNVSNAEVGFIHEFGAPRRNIPASQWMQKANEESADAANEAAGEALGKYIDKL